MKTNVYNIQTAATNRQEKNEQEACKGCERAPSVRTTPDVKKVRPKPLAVRENFKQVLKKVASIYRIYMPVSFQKVKKMVQ